MSDIFIYTKPTCPYCHRAKVLLEEKGLDYKEISILGDGNARNEMLAKAHGRHTVPQIFINGTHIGGCDDLYALEEIGKLDGLLNS